MSTKELRAHIKQLNAIKTKLATLLELRQISAELLRYTETSIKLF